MHSLLLIAAFLGGEAQPPPVQEPLAPLAFLLGAWQGTGEGIGGNSTVIHDFQGIMEGKFIRWHTEAIFEPAEPDTLGERHEDVGYFSYDPARKRIVLRQFLSEGYVNTYHVKPDNEAGALVMTLEHSEGGGDVQARITLSLKDPKRYHSALEMAADGKSLKACRLQVMHKMEPENWLKGLDVSHFSGEVSWPDIKKNGHHFAFAKATEGEDWVDPTFHENMKAQKDVGLIRGAYHFFVAHDDPEVQAKNFIDNVVLEPGDLPPVVDVETLSSRPVPDLEARLKKFLKLIEDHYGAKPIIYTGPTFWDHQVKESFGDYQLWVAEYNTELPSMPQGWQVWSFWQYKGDEGGPGIAKTADFNYFNGDAEALKKLLLK